MKLVHSNDLANELALQGLRSAWRASGIEMLPTGKGRWIAD
jgi:hypothetical protein